MKNWDGESELDSENLVGAYGAIARYVGESNEEGVAVVIFIETNVPMVIKKSDLVTPDSLASTEKARLVRDILDKNKELSEEEAVRLAEVMLSLQS